MLNSKSAHPRHQQINIIKEGHNKTYKLSEQKSDDKNIQDLKIRLLHNNYPPCLVNEILTWQQQQQWLQRTQNNNNSKNNFSNKNDKT